MAFQVTRVGPDYVRLHLKTLKKATSHANMKGKISEEEAKRREEVYAEEGKVCTMMIVKCRRQYYIRI